MHKFTVTIVVPALNEQKIITRCLISVQHLNYPKELIKVIVADNGSRDRTREIARQYLATVIDVPRQSIGYTRNVGAAETDSDIIAFIDADIVVHPNWLAEAVPHFINEEVVAVGSYPAVFEEESNRLQRTWSNLCRNNQKGSMHADWLPSANLIVRRSAFDQIKGFNKNLITCEDSDLGYRLKAMGIIINSSKVLVYHLREPKTFGEFFKKEVWHSAGNLTGAFNHDFRLSELPSLALPALFGAGIVGCAAAPFLGKTALVVSCLLAVFPLCLYVGKGRGKAEGVGFIFCVYFVYLAARSYSFYLDVLQLITLKKFKW